MATIKNYLGEITGKVGGLIFQNNLQGSILRTNRKPPNGLSTARAKSRGTFSSTTKAWSQVNEDFRAAWSYYAQNEYRPKNYKIGKKYSGFNAFVGLKRQQILLSQKICNSNILAGGLCTVSVANMIPTNYVPPNINPACLYTSTGATVPIYLKSAEFTTDGDGAVLFGYDISNGTHPLQFEQPDGNRQFGFIAYANAPNKKSNLTPQIIAFSGFLTVTDGWTTPQIEFTWQWNANTEMIRDYSKWFVAGQHSQMSVYMVTNYGEVSFLGSFYARIPT